MFLPAANSIFLIVVCWFSANDGSSCTRCRVDEHSCRIANRWSDNQLRRKHNQHKSTQTQLFFVLYEKLFLSCIYSSKYLSVSFKEPQSYTPSWIKVKYGAWYLDPKTWNSRMLNEPLTDPKDVEEKISETKKKSKDMVW